MHTSNVNCLSLFYKRHTLYLQLVDQGKLREPSRSMVGRKGNKCKEHQDSVVK